MKALKNTGRPPLLATAAVLALGVAALLAQPLPASALDKVAAANTAEHMNHNTVTAGMTDGIVNVVRDPSDLPGPIGKRGPQRLKGSLETTEVTG